MRRFLIVLAAALLAVLPACQAGGTLRTKAGVYNEIGAGGSRMGVEGPDISINGAAANPVTGECPGGVCNVPKVGLPSLSVEVSPRGLVPSWFWVVACILGLLGVVLLGKRVWDMVAPRAAPLVAPAKAAGTVA
jgi:hypothetical protein